MSDPTLDVVAIGNALVDVIADVGDAFLEAEHLKRGSMTLIDAARAEQLYAAMPPAIEASGGSAGNTISSIAQLGGRAAYIGKVADDDLGRVFRHDMTAAGVTYTVAPSNTGEPTGRCLIVVTPDAQRTMSTYLGAGVELGPPDVDEALIASAKVVFLEGYLWDPPGAKQAFLKAARASHAAGRKVSLTLSDSFCVDRYREEFLELVENEIDVLFANEAEITSLYQVATFDEALQRVRGHCEVAALTRSEKGSVIVAGNEVHVVDPAPVERVVDTTGAGDLYAGGFLYAYTQGMDLARCGRIASICAAEVISHVGPRPEASLRALIA
jgi:sugar/nucleoside kinase (ribokinase family)